MVYFLTRFGYVLFFFPLLFAIFFFLFGGFGLMYGEVDLVGAFEQIAFLWGFESVGRRLSGGALRVEERCKRRSEPSSGRKQRGSCSSVICSSSFYSVEIDANSRCCPIGAAPQKLVNFEVVTRQSRRKGIADLG